MIEIPINLLIFYGGFFMAKGPGILHYTGSKGGKGQPRRIPKPSSLKKVNINLECPYCHIKFRREDVKIWIGKNFGECPSCYRKGKFILLKKPGPVPGKIYMPVIDDVKLAETMDIVKEMKHPCKYLSIADLVEITGQETSVIVKQRKLLGYISHRGRKSAEEEMRRMATYILIQIEGYEPPDLKFFKKKKVW